MGPQEPSRKSSRKSKQVYDNLNDDKVQDYEEDEPVYYRKGATGRKPRKYREVDSDETEEVRIDEEVQLGRRGRRGHAHAQEKGKALLLSVSKKGNHLNSER